ncbi:MAG: nuclear transport factor 2 family protein [Luminiphilus sp.]|nr:nuclear transport factor 2 family protein [Luminiphilus sp.]
MSKVVDRFYEAIRTGDTPTLDAVIAEDFCLICPTQNHVLSGIYEGKRRFFEEVTPHVFGCVNPEDITFCGEHRVIVEAGEVVVTMAQNEGLALTGERYDQTYLHIFKIRDGQIHALIEGFDTALANLALWGGREPLVPDAPAALANVDRFQRA